MSATDKIFKERTVNGILYRTMIESDSDEATKMFALGFHEGEPCTGPKGTVNHFNSDTP